MTEHDKNFHHGYTRQEIVDAIIDFELDNDILPDWREVLEYGFYGYSYTDDDALREMYDEYFTDESIKPQEDWAYYSDGIATDGRGNNV
jgi:bifunctional pyridoxal-dependent enzyme with beta-cystathionase and maltose regulon repressor activities